MAMTMELVSYKYTHGGMIDDDTFLLIGNMVEDDEFTARRPDPHHDGFVDPYYTPQSKAAGRFRIFAGGVIIRVITSRTISMFGTYEHDPKCRVEQRPARA